MSVRRKFLDQQLVTEFAEFRALETKIEKWLTIVREEFLGKFSQGYVCPANGPYLLVVESGSQSNIDWKEELSLRIRSDYELLGHSGTRAVELAAETMVEMERVAGRMAVPRVVTKTNPAYSGKLMRAIVKKLDARSSRGF
jgi:hypothetical protein